MTDTPLPIYQVDFITLPSYEVDFIPIERRLGERRANPDAGLPPGVAEDRRKRERRHGDHAARQSSNVRNT
ncbi:MAG: hypothetical protein AB1591_00890 [Pseudomonadota bacterium]